MSRFQHAIIIGASSGMGCALAQELAQQGTRVALVARRADLLQEICQVINESGEKRAFAYPHDVRQIEEVPALFQQIALDLGGVDLIVYAAGASPPIRRDEYAINKDQDVIAINLLGAMAWLNEAALRFQQLHSGTIVGISSVAGDRGRRLGPAYGVAKAGLTTYLESLRNRLTVQGVHVVTIKPGYVATPMTAGMKLPKVMPVISAQEAAHQILAAAASNRQVVYVPAFWGPFMRLVRAVPSAIFRRLNI